MTGNELDTHMHINPPWDPSASSSDWLKETGRNVVVLRESVTTLQRDLSAAKHSRARLVEAMQDLQRILELPFPDPAKIVAEVKRLKQGDPC